MCMICSGDYTNDIQTLYTCDKLSVIPDTLIHLTTLELNENKNIISIPDTLVKLKFLSCSYTNIKHIPDTLINLQHLYCSDTKITHIPDTFVELIQLNCFNTNITILPDTFKKMVVLSCEYTLITTIPDIYNKISYLCCYSCKWLNKTNAYYTLDWNIRMKKLKIIQRCWKWKKINKKIPLCRDLREYVVKKYYIL